MKLKYWVFWTLLYYSLSDFKFKQKVVTRVLISGNGLSAQIRTPCILFLRFCPCSARVYASIVEIVANVTKEVILVGEILTSIGWFLPYLQIYVPIICTLGSFSLKWALHRNLSFTCVPLQWPKGQTTPRFLSPILDSHYCRIFLCHLC